MDSTEFFENRMQLLAAGDVDSLVDQYSEDAKIVRFLGVANGKDEIRAYLVGLLAAHRSYEAVSLDQVQGTGDSIIWEATVNTAAGPLQIYDVFVFSDDGKITHQFPGVQGYWGSS